MAVAAVWPLSRPCVPRTRITDHATSTGVGVRETEGRGQEAELRGRCVGGGWKPRPCAGGALRRTVLSPGRWRRRCGHPEIPRHRVPSPLQMRSRPGTRGSPGTEPPHSWPGWRDPYASSYPRALSGQSQGWASPRASPMPQGHRRRLGKLLRPLSGHFLRPRGDALAPVSGQECRRRVGVGHPAHSAQPAPRAPRSRAPCAASAAAGGRPSLFLARRFTFLPARARPALNSFCRICAPGG